jgi:DNA-binding response OmpR family regulator
MTNTMTNTLRFSIALFALAGSTALRAQNSVQLPWNQVCTNTNARDPHQVRKEFAVMRLLAARPGIAVTRDELLEQVWGYDARQSTRTVDNHIAALRSKLEAPGEPRHLITIHGVGYKIVLE